jgi:predicted transcriptional regulator
MTTDEGPGVVADGVAFLARSGTRVRILRNLAAAGPLDRDALGDRLDVARTTLARNLAPLVDRGWVDVRNGTEYVLTAGGEAVLSAFDRFADTVSVAATFEPFLRAAPREAFDLDPRHLAGADLVVATESDPYAPITRHVEAIAATGSYRALLPAVGLSALETGTERIEAGATHEVVVAGEVAEAIRSNPAYADPLAEASGPAADAGVRLFVTDESVPFFLGLFDAVVQVGVADENGKPQAIVESRDDAVRSWAEETYAAYRADARPLDLPGAD